MKQLTDENVIRFIFSQDYRQRLSPLQTSGMPLTRFELVQPDSLNDKCAVGKITTYKALRILTNLSVFFSFDHKILENMCYGIKYTVPTNCELRHLSFEL